MNEKIIVIIYFKDADLYFPRGVGGGDQNKNEKSSLCLLLQLHINLIETLLGSRPLLWLQIDQQLAIG